MTNFPTALGITTQEKFPLLLLSISTVALLQLFWVELHLINCLKTFSHQFCQRTGYHCKVQQKTIFPTQGSNPGLPHCRWILYHLSHQGSIQVVSLIKSQYSRQLLLLLSRFCHVRLVATPWTTAHQAPPSMGFSRQQYWSGVPLPSPIAGRDRHKQLEKREDRVKQ